MTVGATLRSVAHPSGRMAQNLATRVEGALWRYNPLRSSGARVAVTADGERVTLSGAVPSSTIKAMAAMLAAAVPGVGQVHNRLVADNELEAQAAMALAHAEPVRFVTDGISLKVIRGMVHLGGRVAAATLEDARAAVASAEAVVRAVPGVRGVVNQAQAVETAAAPQGPGAGVADTGAAGGAAAGAAAAPDDPALAAMAERLQVWRERAATPPG